MKEHLSFCFDNNIKGRVFIAKEGINGTVSGRNEDIEKYKSNLTDYHEFNDIIFKEDEADEHAFKKMHVRVKEEIVTSNLKNISLKNSGKRLSPDELLEFYKSNKDFIIVDARNWYESKIGKFKGAITPRLKSFREWNKAVENLKEYQDKTIITYLPAV